MKKIILVIMLASFSFGANAIVACKHKDTWDALLRANDMVSYARQLILSGECSFFYPNGYSVIRRGVFYGTILATNGVKYHARSADIKN